MKHRLSALILAAGAGTRMKSATPKVLHPLSGVPMLERVLRSVRSLSPDRVAVVLGHGREEVVRALAGHASLDFVRQDKPRGSGHAVRSASDWIRKAARVSDRLIVLCGDTPLIRPETLRALAERHRSDRNAATVLSSEQENPFGYGRIVRDASGRVRRIVEEKDATPEERRIREVNSGIYCFDLKRLLEALPKLKNNNAKREFYLTDVIEILSRAHHRVDTVQLGRDAEGRSEETLGINDRSELAKAEEILQFRILERWMKDGVTIQRPATVYIEEGVEIGTDTVLLPGTQLLGKTRIGKGCRIGPSTLIEDSEIGGGVVVRTSYIYKSRIADRAQIGPFTHLRAGAEIGPEARIGNFSEIKNSTVGRDTKVSHLSYIGDATLGDEINIGAGVITCNFDGVKKHRTEIGSRSFVGSNVNLIAPVKVGAGAVVGAGSTINRDVPADALALERGQPIVKPGWAKHRRKQGHKK